MKTKVILIIMVLTMSGFQIFQNRKTHIFMIGDSTMSIKEKKAFPEMGWGEPFAHFFNDETVVDNRAKNGKSTRTFIREGRWDAVMEMLAPGDYVFVQFGHNDEIETKKSYTNPEDYKANLVSFIRDTRSKNATPILLTSVARRKFNDEGGIIGTHDEYANYVREIAAEHEVAFIDMDKLSQELLMKMGPENSKLLFLHLEKDEHPNYPNGKVDDTHFSELGARKIAQIVLAEVKALKIGLETKVVQR